MSEIKNPLPTQFSIRLSQEEADYVNENLYLLRGDDETMPRSKIFITAVSKAVTNVKPKEIVKEVPLPELVQENEHLKQSIESISKTATDMQERIKELLDEKEKTIQIELPENYREYFWGILEIAKRDGYAKTYGELIQKMLYTFHRRNEFMLTKEDIEYLNQLKNQ